MAQSKHLSTLLEFYADFTMEKLKYLPDIYDAAVTFEDPIERVEGIEALSQYFAHGMGNAQSCSFVFEQVIEAENKAFLTWTMHLAHSAIKGGKPFSVPGASLIEFDSNTGLVRNHRDYYDLGDMVYQHLPIIGFLIQQVRKRLEHK